MESSRHIRHPSGILLAVQLLGVLLYPFMENTPGGGALFGTFGLVVLAMALWVVRRSPWLTWLGLLLALPVAVLSMVNALSPTPWLTAMTALMEAVFYFYATGSLIAYMFHDRFVTTDEFYAAGATFTLLAWAFAYLYVACQIVYPGSFGAQLNADQPRTWVELLFLSFATLSSVGQGDIIPLSPMARSLTMLEQVAGVMYVMLVLSRLVALSQYRTLRPRERHPDDKEASSRRDQ